jgi:hypothetical protein
MAKRGWIGARDQKELDRRRAIFEAYKEALEANRPGDFWKVMRICGIRDDDPRIPEFQELWRAAFDAAKRHTS